jgi:hypothetical protein
LQKQSTEDTDSQSDRSEEISQSLRRAVVSWIEETNLSDNELQLWADFINVAFRSEVVPSNHQYLTRMGLYGKSHSSSFAADQRNEEIKSALMSRLLYLVEESQFNNDEWARWIRPINELSDLEFSNPDADIVYSTCRQHSNSAYVEAALGSSGLFVDDAARSSTSSCSWPSSSTPEPPEFMSAGTLLAYDPTSETWGFANDNESSSSNEYTVVFEMCRDAESGSENEENPRTEIGDTEDGVEADSDEADNYEADNGQRCDDTEAGGDLENVGKTKLTTLVDEADNVHDVTQSEQADIDNDNNSLGMQYLHYNLLISLLTRKT